MQRTGLTIKKHKIFSRPKFPKGHSLAENRLKSIPLSAIEDDVKNLNFLIPVADHAQINLCKTLMTSSVLGYPVPELINYNRSFYDGKSNLRRNSVRARADQV